MAAEQHLSTLASEPDDQLARKAIWRIASRKVADAYLRLEAGDRPDFGAIASDIVAEHGAHLAKDERSRVLPVVEGIVASVLDDDEPSRVTELFKQWQENGRSNGDELFDALQVALSKRLRWVLGKFDSLKRRVNPGEILADLFLRLHQSGVPDTIENRQQFFWYTETVIRNLLLDRIRAEGRQKRAINAETPLDEVVHALEESGMEKGSVALSPEEWLDLTEAIERLPAESRDIIRYRYLWGWSQDELIRLWNVSRPTLCRRQQKALVSLRKALTTSGSSKKS